MQQLQEHIHRHEVQSLGHKKAHTFSFKEPLKEKIWESETNRLNLVIGQLRSNFQSLFLYGFKRKRHR
jgi:hypothetical protein